jgi:ribosomal protein L17
MDEQLKARLSIVIKGEKTQQMVDFLADKYQSKISKDDDIVDVDAIIRRDFDQVMREIYKDLQSRKDDRNVMQNNLAVELENVHSGRETTKALAKKMLDNLDEKISSPSSTTLMSADDVLSMMGARDMLSDADYELFSDIINKTFDDHATFS